MFLKNTPTSMFDRVLNTPLDDTLRLDWSSKCVLFWKPSVFIVLPIIKLQLAIHNSEGFIVGYELDILVIFAGAVLIKNISWNLKLSIVAV